MAVHPPVPVPIAMADSRPIPGPSATPSAPSAYGAAPSAAAQHLIYVLLDSNLPTGGFVASGGLESYAKHGFLHPPAAAPFAVQTGAVGIETPALVLATNAGVANGAPPAQPRARPMSAPAMGPGKAGPAVVAFARAEMENFERSTGAYLSGAWGAVDAALCAPSKAWSADDDVPGAAASPSVASPAPSPSPSVDSTVAALVALDTAHEATLLSHVPRRASRAQGVALLTLHARGMGAPPGFPLDDEADEDEESDGAEPESESESESESEDQVPAETRSGAGVEGRGSGRGRVGEGEGHKAATARRNELARELVAAYRHAIRRGAPGHLAVCFGVVTACLGLDLETTRHLYLFTHARSTLSAAVRLNIIGPYLSTQLLAHPMRKVLRSCLKLAGKEGAWHPEVELAASPTEVEVAPAAEQGGDQCEVDAWAWADEAERGPATTWPLGEILAARHDLQHSRIFNS